MTEGKTQEHRQECLCHKVHGEEKPKTHPSHKARRMGHPAGRKRDPSTALPPVAGKRDDSEEKARLRFHIIGTVDFWP
jgi:hypothetical protein